jgi:hypothetical protein
MTVHPTAARGLPASIVASILGKLTASGSAELSPEEANALSVVVQAGLATRASDDGDGREELARLRARLTHARTAGRKAEEGELREAILTLSDRLAEASGGVALRALDDGGAYRGGGRDLGSHHLTHKGRSLLGDLGPRALRLPGLSLGEFEDAVGQLKIRLDERATRARDIVLQLKHPASVGAARLAALGISARNAPLDHLALYLQQAFGESGTVLLRDEERWSAAESALLVVGALEHSRPIMLDLLKLRQSFVTQYTQGRSEEALDAAVLLLPWPEAERAAAIQRCTTLALNFRAATEATLPLSSALLIERTRVLDELLGARLVSMYRGLRAHGAAESEAVTTAALLSLSDGDASWLVSRADALQSYLGRFSPTPLWSAAGALALLTADVPEILDDLRLASAATQRVLLATSGAEAVGLAVKLLLVVAALGHGSEGDPEESLVLRPAMAPSANNLGMAALATSLPMILAATATFHRPLLTAHDVALSAAPMHSSYVYGSSGYYGGSSSSSGWGGWGSSGGRSWG